MDAASVADRSARRRYVLLGEKHDNPDHHLLQAQLIRDLVARGRRPAVVLEMIPVDRADALAAHLEEHPADADGLGAAVEWDKSGWPPWETYRPIAEAALEGGLALAAGNLPTALVKAARHRRADPLTREEPLGLGIEVSVPEGVRKILAEEIEAAHCGHAPPHMIPILVEIQQARDAQFARALQAAGEEDGAVLIAGNGHVRKGIAVPRFMEEEPPFSIAFTEVRAGELEPSAYARGGVFDVLWFTPRVDDVDPCEHFRERLKRGFEERAE
jgi:uncharacterized iron-regulated protein